MARTNCPACGAEVDICTDADTGETVPLEPNTDASNEAPRYRYTGVYVPKPVVQRVREDAAGDFYPDHRFDCKDFNAGRTF